MEVLVAEGLKIAPCSLPPATLTGNFDLDAKIQGYDDDSGNDYSNTNFCAAQTVTVGVLRMPGR